MSYVSQITCDAPNCTSVKAASNHWWVLRKDFHGFFQSLPMKGHTPIDGDRHLCSTPCMHSMLESWMEEKMTMTADKQGPRCTCEGTYEVWSGSLCPVHEVDSVGMNLRKEINDRERVRMAEQKENNRREEERINRPA